MKIINIHHPYDPAKIPTDPVVLALGFFDGVHKGHQAVINQALSEAKKNNLKLAAMTFDHHPSIVFDDRPNAEVGMSYLTSVQRKAELMAELGVDILYVVGFTSSFAKEDPEEFIQNYIVNLHAKKVVAGFDYTFGPQQIANMDTLPKLASGRFEVIKVDPLKVADQKISSTKIRNKLAAGQIDQVNNLLGYPFETTGVVVHGEARGRTLGFPTINILSNINQLSLGIGIYVVEVKIGNDWLMGMASVGRNIVFGKNRPITTEINILDFNCEVYGEQVKIRWYHRLRGELNFDSVDELINQLQLDEQGTRNFFKNA